MHKVSIPFKRESSWKEHVDRNLPGGYEHSFNSLQTGKFMESGETLIVQADGQSEFPFPSNGKVHGKGEAGVTD